MRLLLILAAATHLSAISAFAQSATFARTNYPFLGNDRLDLALSLGERRARRLEEYDGTAPPSPPSLLSPRRGHGERRRLSWRVRRRGRDAIWSGACSSFGNKTRTYRFTLNGNAAVTANVQ